METSPNPFECFLTWEKLLTAPKDPTPHHQAIAREILGNTNDGLSVDALARTLLEQLRELSKVLGLEKATLEDARAPLQEGGMLWLDTRALKFLAKIGKAGKEAATLQQPRAKERWETYAKLGPCSPNGANPEPKASLWRLWADLSEEGAALEAKGLPPVRFALILADVLWQDEVKPRVERERRNPPGLARSFYQQIHGTLWKQWDGWEKKDETHIELKDGRNRTPANLPAALAARDAAILFKAFDRLGSYTSHLLVDFFITRAHQQSLQNKSSPWDIVIEGGATQLAENIGQPNNTGRENVLQVLRLGQHLSISYRGREVGGLWNFDDDITTARNRKAKLIVALAPILRPYSGLRSLPNDEQFIVPIVSMPDFITGQRALAGQSLLVRQILMRMIEQRAELARGLGALLLPDEIAQMSKAAHISQETGQKALELWQKSGDKTFLEQVGPNRYELADTPTYRLAREFIREGGKRTLAGRAGGIAAAKAAQKPRPKKKPKPTED